GARSKTRSKTPHIRQSFPALGWLMTVRAPSVSTLRVARAALSTQLRSAVRFMLLALVDRLLVVVLIYCLLMTLLKTGRTRSPRYSARRPRTGTRQPPTRA